MKHPNILRLMYSNGLSLLVLLSSKQRDLLSDLSSDLAKQIFYHLNTKKKQG